MRFPPPLHSIFCDFFLDTRSGGPPGYLAHLRVGLDAIPNDPELTVWIDRLRKPESAPARPIFDEASLKAHIQYFEDPERFDLTEDEFSRLIRSRPRSIHLHNSPLAFKVMQALRRRHISNIPVILTSHTPESNGIEMANLYRDAGLSGELTDRFEQAVRNVEEMAFRAADVWMFPSREAMEPYELTIPEFSSWKAGKDIRFVATGCLPPRRSDDSTALIKRLQLEKYKILAFVGRHNHVKGYDLFCAMALRILQERADVAVVVAGPPSLSLPSPTHERWIELGWYDKPGDILEVADVFVLPNRMTYFDLVLIEAVAVKACVLASATGGNRTMHSLTSGGISLSEIDVDALYANVSVLLDEGQEARSMRAQNLEQSYREIFCVSKFAQRYADEIKQIQRDH